VQILKAQHVNDVFRVGGPDALQGKTKENAEYNSFGVGFVFLGESVQESKDLFRCDLINGTIAVFMNKPSDDGPVSSHRIFFRVDLVVIDPGFGCS
jgi:hypothetical protein